MPPDAPSQPFVALINEHQPLIRRVCRLYCQDADDRQDLFQEIVLQLWRAYPRYEPRAKVSTWLYRIALNVAISNLRQRTRRPAPDRLDWHVLEMAQAAEAGYEPSQIDELYRAIEKLSDVEKAFVLLYLEDRSYEEMADILGITQNNVRVKMHRVQDKLRTLLARLV
ncbi:sigma-70 family RNA polymerase sigma factor [Hymenobacter koreensis]|uniref:Sigma-70 family RNA polymerase sigma factor n=1 Tax=Hymenobacter koreensis TaxID=1084523 RepID=A0ABP8IU45_9BACT